MMGHVTLTIGSILSSGSLSFVRSSRGTLKEEGEGGMERGEEGRGRGRNGRREKKEEREGGPEISYATPECCALLTPQEVQESLFFEMV